MFFPIGRYQVNHFSHSWYLQKARESLSGFVRILEHYGVVFALWNNRRKVTPECQCTDGMVALIFVIYGDLKDPQNSPCYSESDT